MNLRTNTWDALVVGAGVAGGCTAALLADRGWDVLLVEKSAWPRVTVCGGCLSAASLHMLTVMGMQHVIDNALPTRSVVWYAGNRSFEHAIPQGAAILRKDLDTAIVDHAIHRGADFLSSCQATLGQHNPDDSFRSITLQSNGQSTQIRARLVIACDGLDGTFLKDQSWAGWSVAPAAFMGLAATYKSDDSPVESGKIHMSIGQHGYVGRVAIDEKTEHLAAAFDPVVCRQWGGPVHLINEILLSCQLAAPTALASARLHGTGKLTRHRKELGTHRLLAVGDSCGYVEPVTGEGMAWAMRGALELNQLLPADPQVWPADLPLQWQNRYAQAIGHQQRWCRLIRTTAHNPTITRTGVFLANMFPGVAHRIAKHVCEPRRKDSPHDSNGCITAANVSQNTARPNPGDRYRQPTRGNAGIVA